MKEDRMKLTSAKIKRNIIWIVNYGTLYAFLKMPFKINDDEILWKTFPQKELIQIQPD